MSVELMYTAKGLDAVGDMESRDIARRDGLKKHQIRSYTRGGSYPLHITRDVATVEHRGTNGSHRGIGGLWDERADFHGGGTLTHARQWQWTLGPSTKGDSPADAGSATNGV